MKYTSLLKFALALTTLITMNPVLFSQDCTVDIDALKGTYTGDCKKGKAEGTGKAVGTDTYEGEFKSGLPDGQGLYVWSNGNTYKGGFQKGLKNGDGEMTYRSAGKPDSVLKGFWKKDAYVGQFQFPYKILTKTKKVTRADIKFASTATGQQVVIRVSTTSSGAQGNMSRGELLPKMEVNLVLQKGIYLRSYVNDTYTTKSETILYDVTYPLQMRVEMGAETVEFLINETGNYVVEITINQ